MQLEDIVALANALIQADSEVEEAEQKLKGAKERARILREETLPSAMQELGMETFTLESGQKVSIKQDVFAQLTAERKPAAFKWLEDNGFGGLIKVEVGAKFGKGEFNDAMKLFTELRNRGLSAEFDQSVHAQTLKAFLREQMASASKVPLDLFGAYPVWTAKISSK